ncbi:MAG: RNA polymerase sigma factor, partial [Flavobacteriales bacterium]
LEGCMRGDRKAQELLYDRFAPRMYGVCRSYADDDLEAQDLLQEGFIKVFQKISECSKEKSLEGWIRKVIVNNNIDLYRKKKQKKRIEEVRTDQDLHMDDVPIRNEGEEELNFQDLLAILRELPQGYRTVLNLYIVEGYDHKAIAESLGTSVSNSKSQYLRAKKYLQQKFGRRTLDRYFAAG